MWRFVYRVPNQTNPFWNLFVPQWNQQNYSQEMHATIHGLVFYFTESVVSKVMKNGEFVILFAQVI